MYLADYHVHTNFSFDSSQDIEALIISAINKNINEICITDHYDFNYPHNEDFTFDFTSYFKILNELKIKYQDKLTIKIGLELGMDLNYEQEIHTLLKDHQFDFIIGSIHVIDNTDFYYQDYFKNKDKDEIESYYLKTTLKCLETFHEINVLGHLDNIVKYLPKELGPFAYEKHQTLIDDILLFLINNNKGIEINTSGLSNASQPYPHFDIIKRYIDLNGQIITIGSDSHTDQTIGNHFFEIISFLKKNNFNHYNIFTKNESFLIKF